MKARYGSETAGNAQPGLARLGIAALIVLGLALIALSGEAQARDGAEGQKSASLDATQGPDQRAKGRESGLPVPRFVSLKAKAVNMRVGPGRKYAIAWRYERRGWPVEIIQELDNWRRIRDAEGTTGWVLHSLLSAKRTAVVAPWRRHVGGAARAYVIGRADASETASTRARIQPGLMAAVEACERQWCRLSAQETRFWLRRDQIWGVYETEPLGG